MFRFPCTDRFTRMQDDPGYGSGLCSIGSVKLSLNVLRDASPSFRLRHQLIPAILIASPPLSTGCSSCCKCVSFTKGKWLFLDRVRCFAGNNFIPYAVGLCVAGPPHSTTAEWPGNCTGNPRIRRVDLYPYPAAPAISTRGARLPISTSTSHLSSNPLHVR